MSPTLRLLDLLARKHVPFVKTDGGIVIQGSLAIEGDDVEELPDNLTVVGSLGITLSRITQLPENLVVSQNLSLNCMPVSCLPKSLQVDGDLSVLYSQVASLPAGFHARGSLVLKHAPITALPTGMRVGGALGLRHTPIQRLPPDMVVQGCIYPPFGLLDVAAFMQTCAPNVPVSLSLAGSRHHVMQQRARLLRYPDVWTVLSSIDVSYSMIIAPKSPEGYKVRFLG